MPTESKCPKCGSTKTMPVPDSTAVLCYACRFEFAPETSFVRKRVFISYGHDEHAPLTKHRAETKALSTAQAVDWSRSNALRARRH